jgi:hypothetical protein
MLEVLPFKAVTAMPIRQVSAKTSTPLALPTPVRGAQTPVERDNAGSDDQIAEITGRLERRYPPERISRSDLEARVRSAYKLFDTARVRTFVAVLVERLVRRSVEQASTTGRGSGS